jgi:NAD+ kinase
LRVGLISRTDNPSALTITKQIIKHLSDNSINFIIETETALALEIKGESIDIAEMDVNFLIVVGGDGTILRAAMGVNPTETPILGINMGRRGYLCEVTPEEALEAINRVLKGDYTIENCLKLSSRSQDLQENFPDALNEVLVSSSLPSKMILTRISVNGELLTEIQADGIIVSTPTGSTAYNISAGGSIIAQGVDAMIVTAICPYSYFRSIVLPSSSKVSIEMIKPKADALAIIDGKIYTALKALTKIDVEASKNKTRFIRFRPFYGRLRVRLSHLESA